jgi:hypothetical protein
MKSYNIFSKSIIAKSPNFGPSQFRNRGVFWETKNIFGKHYPNTLKNAQKTPILKQFFLSDRLSMDCTYSRILKRVFGSRNIWMFPEGRKKKREEYMREKFYSTEISRDLKELRWLIKFKIQIQFLTVDKVRYKIGLHLLLVKR